MTSDELMRLLTRYYHRISGFLRSLNDEYGLEWLLVVIAALAVIIFLLREKPVTNLLKFTLGHLWRWLKMFGSWCAGKFRKLRIKPLSPRLKTLASELDAMAASPFGRYDRPHYVILNYGADIPTLMRSANDHDSETLQLTDSKQNEDGDRQWYVFNRGCVFHFADPVSLVGELQQIRPERPLDGLIVCISAKHLLEDSPQALSKQADSFYRQIWKIQAKYHFVLPVYVVVTESEHIQGYEAFWRPEALQHFKTNLFGWSNPHDKLKPFDGNWISEAINDLGTYLRRIQLNFLSNLEHRIGLDYLLFPSRFTELETPIRRFCDVLFAHSSFHENFMFRGFYFCGAQTEQDKTETDSQASLEPKVSFARDLFYKRIFAEANLAYAPKQQIFSSDRRLRWYQTGFVSVFIALFTWLLIQQDDLAEHARNLQQKLHSLPVPEQLNTDISQGPDIHYVTKVLDHIASMDASNLEYASIPWSYMSTLDQQLTDYFAKNIFGSVVFPAMECRADKRINLRLSKVPSTEKFSDWLVDLANDITLHERLNTLMRTTYQFSSKQVEQEFKVLVQHLFNQTLPESFYQRSDTYIRAIQQYTYIPGTSGCGSLRDHTDRLWDETLNVAGFQLQQMAGNVAAPKNFFTRLPALESLPTEDDWFTVEDDFNQDLESYLDWSARLKRNWLHGHGDTNVCKSSQAALTTIAAFTNQDNHSLPNTFEKHCLDLVYTQLRLDDPLFRPALFKPAENGEFDWSPEALRLWSAIQQISELSFIKLPRENKTFTEPPARFFWSIDGLNKALRMYEEYETFARIHYQSVALPETSQQDHYHYVAQAIALKQLQLAMRDSISAARIQEPTQRRGNRYRPVNRQESMLASYVENFRRAQEPLLKLQNIFKALGANGTETWLASTASQHAVATLKDAHALVQASHLYQPRDSVLWGAHGYVNALFGIATEAQLKDYLTSQSSRFDYVATQYVEPLLVFLDASGPSTKQYELVSLWRNTLIELSKKVDNKDVQTTQIQLEQFLSNQLMQTTQSNCFAQSKIFEAPMANDLFAATQRHIITQAKSLCESYRKDEIEKDYAVLFDDFTELLANKYPFAPQTGSRNVSPAELNRFMSRYAGNTNGLAKRMDTLAWAKRDTPQYEQYRKAKRFVEDLDKAMGFFQPLLAQGQQASVDLTFEFNVLPEASRDVEHISSWEVLSGTRSLRYPSQQSSALTWAPNQSFVLNLQWAENSPFTASAKNGVNKGNTLVYQEDGFWSLLRFIQRYRSNLEDAQSLTDESILLSFSAEVRGKGAAGGLQREALANARMTLYGLDAENKQRLALSLPGKFPQAAPKLGGEHGNSHSASD